MEKKGCGMFGIDCIVIFLAVSWILPNIILSIIATLVGAAILYALMQIPVFGRILVGLCGLVVAFGVYSAVESLTGGFGKGKMSQMFTEKPAMWWAAVIIGTLISVGLHFVTCPAPTSAGSKNKSKPDLHSDTLQYKNSFSENGNQNDFGLFDSLEDVDISPEDLVPYEPDSGVHPFQRAADMFNSSQESYIDIMNEISDLKIEQYPQEFTDIYGTTVHKYEILYNRMKAYVELLDESSTSRLKEMAADIEAKAADVDKEIVQLRSAFRLLKQTQQTSSSNNNSFFQGCKTLEDLKKRYNNLTKTFHPDLESGDEETMKLVNAEYEKLKKELSD